jgi:preprotein translocase subunit SecD
LALNLTGATETKLPTSEFHTVQMSMDQASSTAFAQYTAANIGKQLAFVRNGVVLAAPAISQPIDGQSIQISGELSASTAATISKMLRDGA